MSYQERAIELSQNMLEILKSLKGEFEAQDPLIRTLARGDFARKLGSSIEDWIEKFGNLVLVLGELRIGKKAEAGKISPAVGDCEKLAQYFGRLLAIIRLRIHDPKILSAGLTTLSRGEEVARRLADTLRLIPFE